MSSTGPDEQSSDFEVLFEHTSDCIVEGSIQDGKPIVHRVNDAFESVFGYTTSELRGENLNDFITSDGKRDEVEAVDQAIREGDIRPREVTRQTADGPREFLLRATGGQGELSYAIYTDITAQKERERELEELTTRLELALEGANTGIWEWDLETDEVIWDRRMDQLFGYEPGEFDGSYEAFRTRVHPDDIADVEAAHKRAMRERFYEAEFRVYVDGKTERWVHARAQVFYDDSEPTEMIGIVTDITDQKEREQELQRQNERLDTFASVVSHDLRNPLNVAVGRLELAKAECDSEHLEVVSRAHDRMLALVDDLLLLSRHGSEVITIESVAFPTVVKECWQTVETREAELLVNADLTMEADRGRVKQLLENLFRNAIEHGGRDVTITVGELSNPKGFYVEDDGAGISETAREQVFDVGFSTSEEGTGFGLEIVREIAEAHDWTIRVTDGTDGGARFEITGIETTD